MRDAEEGDECLKMYTYVDVLILVIYSILIQRGHLKRKACRNKNDTTLTKRSLVAHWSSTIKSGWTPIGRHAYMKDTMSLTLKGCLAGGWSCAIKSGCSPKEKHRGVKGNSSRSGIIEFLTKRSLVVYWSSV